jgi:hypothetical protein
MKTLMYFCAGSVSIFYITKLIYYTLRFNLKSNSIFMISLVIIHVICGILLYPIYPLLHFQFWKF